MSEDSPDLLVVGGGIIGLSIAEACAREGLAVTVLEAGALGREATGASAGMIPAAHDHLESEAFERLKGRGSDLFRTLSERLRATTGVDNGFRTRGGIELASEASRARVLRQETRQWDRQGVAWREIDGEELRHLELEVAIPVHAAYLLESYAVVEPDRHVAALAASCERHGVQLIQGVGKCRLQVREGRVEGVVTADGDRYRSGMTVVAAGAWSQELLKPLGISLDTRPIRGQMVCFRPREPLFRHVLLWDRRYLVPRSGGRVILGSTEEDVGFDKRTTAEAIDELVGEALAVVPALADAPLDATWAGLRPGCPDGLPFLGRPPGTEGLLVAAGHYRNGLLMSASTAELISQWIRGVETTIPVEDFDPGRGTVAAVAV